MENEFVEPYIFDNVWLLTSLAAYVKNSYFSLSNLKIALCESAVSHNMVV